MVVEVPGFALDVFSGSSTFVTIYTNLNLITELKGNLYFLLLQWHSSGPHCSRHCIKTKSPDPHCKELQNLINDFGAEVLRSPVLLRT